MLIFISTVAVVIALNFARYAVAFRAAAQSSTPDSLAPWRLALYAAPLTLGSIATPLLAGSSPVVPLILLGGMGLMSFTLQVRSSEPRQ